MKTHYDVLKLDKNCTDKEIKASFIELSKKYHPDVNKSLDAHKKFIQVNEAYSVLGKAVNRLHYDASLQTAHHQSVTSHHYYDTRTHPKYYNYVYNNHNRSNTVNASSSSFFNTKLKAVLLCCVLLMVGTSLRIKVATRQRDTKSQKAAKAVRLARARGKELGMEQVLLNISNAAYYNEHLEEKENSPKEN